LQQYKIEVKALAYQATMEPTEEQLQVINYVGSIRVLAAAGSGKTTTMAKKVKGEIDTGRCKAEEICFITFTRFAAKQIKDKVEDIVGHEINILCGTFHSMVYKLRQRAGLGATESKNLYDQRMDVWVQEFMAHLQARHPALVKILRAFKILIIDERELQCSKVTDNLTVKVRTVFDAYIYRI
jgi:superfamily I DNA/RNA helicase